MTGAERSPGSCRFIQMLNGFSARPDRRPCRDGVRPLREVDGEHGEHIIWAAREEPLKRPLVSLTGIEMRATCLKCRTSSGMFVEPAEPTFQQKLGETKPTLHLAAAESPFSRKEDVPKDLEIRHYSRPEGASAILGITFVVTVGCALSGITTPLSPWALARHSCTRVGTHQSAPCSRSCARAAQSTRWHALGQYGALQFGH